MHQPPEGTPNSLAPWPEAGAEGVAAEGCGEFGPGACCVGEATGCFYSGYDGGDGGGEMGLLGWVAGCGWGWGDVDHVGG